MKTPREIAEEISGNELEVLDLIEQAIQAERDFSDLYRKHNGELNNKVFDLEDENSRMREAMRWIMKFARSTEYIGTMMQGIAGKCEKALTKIPETDKYAKIREAELAVVEAIRTSLDANWGAHNTLNDAEQAVFDLLEELDQLKKESGDK